MTTDLAQLHIVVPIFNEAQFLSRTVNRLLDAFQTTQKLNIYLVDDGSTDRSWRVISELACAHPGRIHSLKNDYGKGKGGAIRTALSRIDRGLVAIQDADLEYHPEDLARLVKSHPCKRDGWVIGSRLRMQNRFLSTQRLQNQLLSGMVRAVTGSQVTDIACCYKVFDVGCVKHYPFRYTGFGFDFELAALLLRQNPAAIELPVRFSPRTRVEGKKLRLRHGLAAVCAFLMTYNGRLNGGGQSLRSVPEQPREVTNSAG